MREQATATNHSGEVTEMVAGGSGRKDEASYAGLQRYHFYNMDCIFISFFLGVQRPCVMTGAGS